MRLVLFVNRVNQVFSENEFIQELWSLLGNSFYLYQGQCVLFTGQGGTLLVSVKLLCAADKLQHRIFWSFG